MESTLKSRIMGAFDTLKAQRQSFEEHWKECSEYVSPRVSRWLSDDWKARGNKANKKIIDFTASDSLRALEAAFSSSITPSSRPWKQLKVEGQFAKDYQVSTYLAECNDVMDANILQSNFYSEASKFYAQAALFGTGCMLIEEDDETDIYCETLPIGSYYLGTDRRNRVNCFGREMKMNAMTLAKEFGVDALSISAKRCYDEHRVDTMFTVLHLIKKNDTYDPSVVGPDGKMYSSTYYDPSELDPNKALRVSGYEDFPVIAMRWKSFGDDVYGIDCPGMMCLGSIKELQYKHKQVAKAQEKQVSPPVQAPEGTNRNTSIDASPNAVNYTPMRGTNQTIAPLYTVNFDVSGTLAMIQDLRQNIRSGFFYNLFLMVANERRSGTKAREIDELHEEKMIALSAVYEQFSNEFLDPAVSRIFNILTRRGHMPLPPEHFAGQKFEIEYISVMAQAMKLVGVGNMDRALALVGQVGAARPEVMDLLNFDRFTTHYLDRLGIDPRDMNSPEEMQAIRQARAQQQMAQQQMAAQQQSADVAKVLSDTKTTGDTALADLQKQSLGL